MRRHVSYDSDGEVVTFGSGGKFLRVKNETHTLAHLQED